jgi:hypothetical protein
MQENISEEKSSNAIREFAQQIGKQNFFTFGEVFDPKAEEDIARFIGRNARDVNGARFKIL